MSSFVNSLSENLFLKVYRLPAWRRMLNGPLMRYVVIGELKTRRIGYSIWCLTKMIRESASVTRRRIWRWSENSRITCYNRKKH